MLHSSIAIEDILDALEVYGDLAGSELLTRALVAERNQDRAKAKYWVDIYNALIEREAILTKL